MHVTEESRFRMSFDKLCFENFFFMFYIFLINFKVKLLSIIYFYNVEISVVSTVILKSPILNNNLFLKYAKLNFCMAFSSS